MEVNIVKQLLIYSLIALLTTFMIFQLNQAVNAWTPSQHISLGLLLTEDIDDNFTAFSIGFASHIIADYFPLQQYRFDIFNPSGNWDIVLLEGFLSAYLLYDNWDNEPARWAIIGSLAPDIIDGIMSMLDRKRWYSGEHFFSFHQSSNQKRKSKEATMLFSIVMVSF